MMRIINVSSLAMLFALTTPTIAVAQANLEAALAKCRTEVSATQRLACYDRIELSHNTATTAMSEATNKANAVNKTAEAAVTRNSVVENFGKEHRVQHEQELDQLVATVQSVTVTPRRTLIITLENGQTWRQTDSAFLNVAAQDTIHIRRGTLGAFFLSKEGSNRNIRVRRDD